MYICFQSISWIGFIFGRVEEDGNSDFHLLTFESEELSRGCFSIIFASCVVCGRLREHYNCVLGGWWTVDGLLMYDTKCIDGTGDNIEDTWQSEHTTLLLSLSHTHFSFCVDLETATERRCVCDALNAPLTYFHSNGKEKTLEDRVKKCEAGYWLPFLTRCTLNPSLHLRIPPPINIPKRSNPPSEEQLPSS